MTITANIHGCPAWASSSAILIGQRRTNGGNAYECTFAGTTAASGGPTGTGGTIIDGTVTWKWLSAVDYTTLSAWGASMPATLTEPMIGQLWKKSNNASDTQQWTYTANALTISGVTTSSINTITLTTGPGESFSTLGAGIGQLNYNQLNGVGLAVTGGFSYGRLIDTNTISNFIISGIQFKNIITSSNSLIIYIGSSSTVNKCIFEGGGATNSSHIYVAGSGGIITISNCLLYNASVFAGGTSQYTSLITCALGSSTTNVTNCTLLHPTGLTPAWTSGAIQTSYTTINLKNVAIFGFSLPLYNRGGTAFGNTYVITDVASWAGSLYLVTPGAGVQFSKTYINQFVNNAAGTVNALIKDSASDLYGTGTLSGMPAEDIRGFLRGTQPDVGAAEFTDHAAPPTMTITSQSVQDQTVVISGTTTNIPVSGTCTLPALSGGSVTQGPSAITLGSGTFTITFTNVPVGTYSAPSVTVVNASGTVTASTGGTSFTTTAYAAPTFTIGAITPGSTQVTISGTTSHFPTSGTVTINPNTPANGAVTKGPEAIILDNMAQTWSITMTSVAAGDYLTPVVSMTNSIGTTSTPTSGGAPFSVAPAPGTPTGLIVSQTFTNNTLIITGTTTGIPLTGTVTITQTGGGAVSQGPLSSVYFSGVGNVDFIAYVYNVQPGNYAAPTVLLTNGLVTNNPANGGTIFTAPALPLGGAIIRNIGVGRDDPTLSAFATWVNARSLVTNNEIITAYLHDNTIITSQIAFRLLESNNVNNCTIQPYPGLGVNDFNNTGAADYGTQGIEIQLNGSYAIICNAGIKWQGIRFSMITGTPGQIGMAFTNNSAPGSNTGNILRVLQCRFKNTSSGTMTWSGQNASSCLITDCMYIQEAGSGFAHIELWTGSHQRNTYLKRGSNTSTYAIDLQNYGTATLRNSAFVGFGAVPIKTTTGAFSSVINNFNDTAITGTPSGWTINPDLIVSTSDLRPSATGALLGTADSTAISINDVRGNNRGLLPDAASVQRTPAAPMPTVAITSMVVDGQNVTISGTTTGTPITGSISLPAAISNPNGAISTASVVVTLGVNTFTVTLAGLAPGNYDPPVVLFSNAGGSANSATGGQPTFINGISGTPQGNLQGAGISIVGNTLRITSNGILIKIS